MKLLASGDTISKLGSMLGLDKNMVTKAITAAVPALLAALAGTASKAGGAKTLADTVSKQDDSLLDNLGDLFSGGDAADKGSSMLSSVLGNEGLGQIGGVLSKFTGVGESSSSKLLGLLGPVVLGAVGKQAKGMDASGLADLLAGQKDNIASALPSGLGKMLGSAVPGISGLLDSATGAAESATEAAQGVAREAKAAGSSLGRLIVPAILALLAIMLLPKMCKKAEDAGNAVKDKVADTAGAVTDGTKFISEASDLIKSATESLGSITDGASASAAIPQLRDITTKIGGLEGMLAKLPASVQSTVHSALRPLIAKLRETAASIPVVGGQIKPVLDEMFGHLDKMVPPA